MALAMVLAMIVVPVVSGQPSQTVQSTQSATLDFSNPAAATNLPACSCINDVIQRVNALPLKRAQHNGLLWTLTHAGHRISKCQTVIAGRVMARFVTQTQRLVQIGSLNQAAAAALADCARSIRLCGLDCGGATNNQPPVALVKSLVLSADANCQANPPASQFDNGSYDPAGVIVSRTVTPAGPYPIGETAVTFTVVNNRGIATSVPTAVLVQDTAGPSASNFAPYFFVFIPPGQSGGTAIFPTPAVSASCGGVAAVSYVPPSGSFFPLGVTPVELIMVDGFGATNQISFNVVVLPNSGGGSGGGGSYFQPVALASAVTNAAGEYCQAVVTADQVDNHSFSPTGIIVSRIIQPAGPFAIGTTPVTLTVVDNHGLSNSTQTTVTILDQTPPTLLALPADIVVSLAAGQQSVAVQYPALSVTDTCSTVAGVNFTPPSGTAFRVGTNSVVGRVFNTAGLTNAATFRVIVQAAGTGANQPPVALAKPLVLSADADCQANPSAAAFDNGSFDPDGVIVNRVVTPPGPYPLGETVVTYTVIDNSGALDSVATTVRVKNTTGPSVSNFSPNFYVFVTPDQSNGTAIFPAPAVSDNCANVALVKFSPPSGSVFPVGVNPATLIVADDAGNTNRFSFNVVVLPITGGSGGGGGSILPPVAMARAVTNAADANCQAVVTAAQVDNHSFSPNPGGSIVSESVDPTGPFPVGSTTTVTLTVVDNLGQSNSAVTTVTVLDRTPPTILATPVDIKIAPELGQQSVVVNYPTLSVTDTCSSVTVSCTPPSGTTFGLGTNSVSCQVVSESGNTNSTSFHVVVTGVGIGGCDLPGLIQAVEAIPLIGSFNGGRQRSLILKLQKTQMEIKQKRYNSAYILLQSFVIICKTYRTVHILDSSTVQPLIDCAINLQQAIAPMK